MRFPAATLTTSRTAVALLVALLSAVTSISATPIATVGSCDISVPDGQYEDEVNEYPQKAQVWRLYQAFFLRQPDRSGFDYWSGVSGNGASLQDIAFAFSSGAEFYSRYGDISDGQFVSLVYVNVLCRSADDEGAAYWTGLLTSGEISRWSLMVNFVELREYLRKTSTCHSAFPAESAVLTFCSDLSSGLTPLKQAAFAQHGYQEVNISDGAIRGVEVDMTRSLVKTSSGRCSVASINANWLVASEKDSVSPGVIGIGVINGVHVKGSSDRSDRGVFGQRVDATPNSVVQVWPGDTLSDDDTRLSSVIHRIGSTIIESWHASAETSPYLKELAPQEIVPPSAWQWAAAGIPLIVDGQLDQNFNADYRNDPYTYATTRHTFVAANKSSGRMVIGGTSQLNVRDLVNWATANGYDDLVKFDGGGSAEYNVAGRAVVAGTSRDIPVWLGVGC